MRTYHSASAENRATFPTDDQWPTIGAESFPRSACAQTARGPDPHAAGTRARKSPKRTALSHSPSRRSGRTRTAICDQLLIFRPPAHCKTRTDLRQKKERKVKGLGSAFLGILKSHVKVK